MRSLTSYCQFQVQIEKRKKASLYNVWLALFTSHPGQKFNTEINFNIIIYIKEIHKGKINDLLLDDNIFSWCFPFSNRHSRFNMHCGDWWWLLGSVQVSYKQGFPNSGPHPPPK